MTHGFSDLMGDEVLTGADIAARMGRPSWAALMAWLRRSGLTPPPRLYGTRRFRARDVAAWAAMLPTTAPDDRDQQSAGWSGGPPAPINPEKGTSSDIGFFEAKPKTPPGVTHSISASHGACPTNVVPEEELARRRALALSR